MMMTRTRIACAASNRMTGRPEGMRPEAIVLHRSGGTAEAMRARFTNGATLVSTHYVVTRQGDIVQYVDENDTAFHAGIAINASWKRLKARVNPNFYTLGIELEGSPDDTAPQEQSDACAELVAEISARRNIPIDADHIVLHSEIRASRDCPGSTLDRADILQRALLAATAAQWFPAASDVEILRDTNLREGAPSSAAQVVSVLRAGSKMRVTGFTLQGEAVKGNTAWYRIENGDCFFADNSSVPRPRPDSDDADNDPPARRSAISLAVVRRLGINDIDQFFAGSSGLPVELARAGRETVGTIQDLLTGQGLAQMPSILSPAYGIFSARTQAALAEFQNGCGLPISASLTEETARSLIEIPAKDPRATQAYFSLALGIPRSGLLHVLALTSQMEGVGRFAALNLNTDSAGLSFGMIQWAQRPGRLVDILSAFRNADSATFARIFGGGDAVLADYLLAHLRKPHGGVSVSGTATDSRFDLITPPWPQRFREAAFETEFQKVQVNTALAAFETSLEQLRQFDTAGLVKSERGVAFMLDVANQFGEGGVRKSSNGPDRGLAGIYRKLLRPGMTERDLLQAIADATVAAMPVRFQAGVRCRRSLFLTTSGLSDSDEFTSG